MCVWKNWPNPSVCVCVCVRVRVCMCAETGRAPVCGVNVCPQLSVLIDSQHHSAHFVLGVCVDAALTQKIERMNEE